MSWIDDISNVFKKKTDSSKHEIPEGVWTKCEACNQVLYRSELERNLNVCPKCGHHMRIKARTRLESFLDADGREELGTSFETKDVLRFKDLKRYKDRYTAAQKSTGEKDALVVLKGTLKGIPVVACAFEFNFMAGSMGSVVGARFCLAAHECLKENRGLVCFSTSGGARMQESLLSLMQMAKTSAVLSKLAKAHLPFISVMSDPTMGGVSASLAMLGDVNIAEPHALIGFAGPRVIEQTVREKLPEGFQLAEFLLEKGAIDKIVTRHKLRDEISELLAKMQNFKLVGDHYEKNTTTLGLDLEGAVAVAESDEHEEPTTRKTKKTKKAEEAAGTAEAAAEAANEATVDATDADSVEADDAPRKSRTRAKAEKEGEADVDAADLDIDVEADDSDDDAESKKSTKRSTTTRRRSTASSK